MNRPFYSIPFHADPLGAILDLALSHGRDTHNMVFLFPHSRPGKYIIRALAERPDVSRPLLEPSFPTISSLFAELHRGIAGQTLWSAGLMDRAGLVYECLQATGCADLLNLRAENTGIETPEAFAADDFADVTGTRQNAYGTGPQGMDPATLFFPWGFHMADLFEECLAGGVPPTDISHAESAAAPFAALLLERLGRIFTAYAQALRERGWTTPGLDAFTVAQALRTGRELPFRLFAGKRIYVAGFHTLTRPEETLLHRLYTEHDAHIILRADLPAETAHWSCEPLFAWARRERAQILPLPATPPASEPVDTFGTTPLGAFISTAEDHSVDAPAPTPTRLRFVQGFDLHSQLKALQEELAANPLPESHVPPPPGFAADTAVVLPSGDLLLPTLHHLPATDINVSMGYPPARSPLFRLIETVLRLEEGRKGHERHWKDLLELLRHPALTGLDPTPPPAGEDGDVPEPSGNIRRELHLLEDNLRSGGAVYVDPGLLWREILAAKAEDPDAAGVPPTHDKLVRQVLSACLTRFENLATPHEAGRALEGICTLLLEHGPHLWPHHPIDSECLYRLLQSLIPELLHSPAAHVALPREALFALVRKLIEAERVPFEAEPLTGVQVLGILETRLLSFRRVIVLDAGEHVLPGTPQGDPLLPDSLRPALGLPERRTAEIPAAHHFFSLIHGAEEALILWREGGDAGGLFDGKKIKSRFVEELLWEEEKKLGRLLAATGDDGPLRVLADTPAPVMAAPRAIPVTPAIRALMDNLLRRPVSASLLDAYLFCPVRFFHERILKMREADAPSEEYDPPAVGVLLHKTLEAFYRERLHTPLPAGADMPESEFEALREIFLQRPELAALDRLWPADALSMLRVSGPTRLQRYLRRQPACTPLLLEQSFSAPLRVGRDITLTGTVDRLDLRDDGAVILDYKTGKIPRILQSVWGDEAFWDGLDGFGPEDPLLPGFIAQAFPSVQLPLYLYLMGMASGLPEPTQAAWVELAADGDEAPLFGKTVTEEQRDRAVNEQIPQLVGMTLQSLAETGEFRPHPGPHCRWCSCRSACMLPVAE